MDATRLNRLLPHTLLWRAFWLIALLMLLAVGAWLMIFREAELEPRARQLAQMVTSVTNLTRAALVAAHPEHRHDLLAELSDREGVRVYLATADDRIVPPPSRPLTHRIEALLREQLGPETQLAFVLNDEPGLFIRFRIFAGAPDDEGDFWLALPRERLERHFPLQWLAWGGAVLLLSLAGAWLIVYRIVRPLEDERALLLAGISHDLRTPLTRLRMETEMSVTDADARAGMAADIAEMDRTIGQFLDFARPEAHPATPPAPVALTALLDEIAGRYGAQVRRPAGADFHAHAHPAVLRRAIVNLIENALHHGDGATPVELGLMAEGREVVIAVLDRGPGIAPEQVTRLKQPFTRGEAARTGAGGAGLGLAIVERIVRAEGGRLELLPRDGGGLAAHIRLPRATR
jgi:two-component system, OmpR family, osmolarity sensor histidine kinase EnvZ